MAVSPTQDSKPALAQPELAAPLRLLLYGIFIVSGAAGLVYETTWVRMFGLVFGNTVYSVTAVLSAFMAGLALGSWLFGRWADRHPHPLRLYALLEAGIAVTGAASPWVLSWLEPRYVWLYHATALPLWGITVVKFVLSFLLLLVPTALMGGTFPVLNRFVVRRLSSLGKLTGALYGVNTLGAVAGTLLTAFWLIGMVGVHRAVAAAALLNLVAAACAGGLSLLARDKEPPAPPEAAAPGRDPLTPTERLAALTFACSGFAALGYEVVWTRTLVYNMGTSVYAFAIMLATFLLGIAIGPLLVGRWADRTDRPLWSLALIQGGIALVSVAGLSALTRYLWTPPSAVLETDFLAKALRAGAVMMPSALLMGATFPMAARAVVRQQATLARRLGRIYAMNTLAGILGSLLAGLVLLRWLGVWQSMLVLATVNLLMALVLVGRSEAGRLRLPAALLVLLLLGLGAGWLRGVDPFRRAVLATEQQWGENVFYREGEYATVTVFTPPAAPLQLSIDGITMTKLTVDTQIMAHLPLALIPHPRRALLICFGEGSTFNAARAHPELEQIDAVELVPAVVEAYRTLTDDPGSLQDPRATIHVTDGRNFLLLSRQKYDLISVDPPVPAFSAGAVMLSTREFFELCKAHLTPQGIMMNWLPEISPAKEMCTLAATFHSVFPHATVWRSPDHHGVYMLGTQQPLPAVFDMKRLLAGLSRPGVVANMAKYRPAGKPVRPAEIPGLFMLDERGLAEYSRHGLVMTDDRPYVEFPLQLEQRLVPPPSMEQFSTTLAAALAERPAAPRP